MSDPTIAFQRQPLEFLARSGKLVAEQVIHALSDWARSDWTTHLGSHRHNRLYVLDAPTSPWRVVVIARERHRQGYWLDVCAVDDAKVADLVAYYEPFAELDHIAAMMEIKLKKLDPLVIARVAESLELPLRLPHHGRAQIRWHSHEHTFEPALRLLHVIDSSADRWASSKARNQFKTLLDDARERPQVVEREGDDLVVVSRRYLQETVDPSSAKGLSRRYVAMGLSDDDMPVLEHGALPPLADLPEIRSV